jgi:hypothetical protein
MEWNHFLKPTLQEWNATLPLSGLSGILAACINPPKRLAFRLDPARAVAADGRPATILALRFDEAVATKRGAPTFFACRFLSAVAAHGRAPEILASTN